MIESRQSIIEIPDCDYLAFQGLLLFPMFFDKSIEFLRFLYYNEVKGDTNLHFKLFMLADQYVQNDLSKKCLSFLTGNINSDNVYTILDFARKEDISRLREYCIFFLKKNINCSNISELVKYLNEQKSSDFDQENLELRNKALTVVTQNYLEIPKNQETNAKFYEDFLLKNIGPDTLLILANFTSGPHMDKEISGPLTPKGLALKLLSNQSSQKELKEEEKEKLRVETTNLRTALYSFVRRNLKSLKEDQIVQRLPNAFFIELLENIPDDPPYEHQKDLCGRQQQKSQEIILQDSKGKKRFGEKASSKISRTNSL